MILLDFVYSWLGNFCVDKNSKMVRALEFYEKDRADNLWLQLLLGLQASQNINENLWEYNAFVEFLEVSKKHYNWKNIGKIKYWWAMLLSSLSKYAVQRTTSKKHWVSLKIAFDRPTASIWFYWVIVWKQSKRWNKQTKEQIKITIKTCTCIQKWWWWGWYWVYALVTYSK